MVLEATSRPTLGEERQAEGVEGKERGNKCGGEGPVQGFA